jgi:hypothetical protein
MNLNPEAYFVSGSCQLFLSNGEREFDRSVLSIWWKQCSGVAPDGAIRYFWKEDPSIRLRLVGSVGTIYHRDPRKYVACLNRTLNKMHRSVGVKSKREEETELEKGT